MDDKQFEQYIAERKQQAITKIKKNIKKQWGLSAVLTAVSLAMCGAGIYLLTTGGYVLGSVLLAVGVGVTSAVIVLHVRALKKLHRVLGEVNAIGEDNK